MIKLDLILRRSKLMRAIELWKPYKPKNPWFKKAAVMIAKNSRINVYVSYWRMRDAAFS